FVVADKVSVVTAGVCGVAFDRENGVLLTFIAGGVFDSDGEFSGIVLYGHLLGAGGTPNAQIAHGSLLARERLLLRDGVPLVALRENRVSEIFPNVESACE